MDKSNPIEIINPGNGNPGGTVSPQVMVCDELYGGGGYGGGECPPLSVPICPYKLPCPTKG